MVATVLLSLSLSLLLLLLDEKSNDDDDNSRDKQHNLQKHATQINVTPNTTSNKIESYTIGIKR